MKHVRIEGGVKLTRYITPMLATLTDKPAFDDPHWIFEIKWDGYRAVAEVNENASRFYSRNGLSFTKAYPKIYDAIKAMKVKAIIDGEVVVYDMTGKPSFQHLQNYNSRQKLPIQYQVFDCLEYKGKDITRKPLLERKKILKELLPNSDFIKYCDHVEEEGIALYNHAVKAGLEGIIAKRSSSFYTPGKRTNEWLKIKNVKTDDYVIVGFTDPQGSRKYFGGLILATEKNGKLIYAGNVGTGFTDKLLKELYNKLKPIEQKKSPLDTPIKETKEMHWVKLVYVCQINYSEVTEEGYVRHPSFQGPED